MIVEDKKEEELRDDLVESQKRITELERSRAECQKALCESEEQYRILFDGIPVGLYRTTPEGKILDVNPTLMEIMGYPDRESLLKVNAADVYVHPEERTRWRFLMESETVVRNFEMQLRRADGTTAWIRHSARAVLDNERKVLYYEGAVEDITERKQMEEKLRATSLYTRSLIEASLDPLVTISPEGKITDVNKATELVTGQPRDYLIGSDFSEYFTEPEKAREGYQKVLSEGFVKDYYLTIRHTSGQATDVLYNATLYRNEAGEMQGVFAAARDVTERKQMEEKLRATSLYTRSLIEASLDPLVTISPEGKITDVNKATELVTGDSRDHLVGSDFSEYFTEPEKAREGYQKVLSEGFVKDYYLTIRHTSGQTTDVLYNATLYRNEAGEMQGVFAAARDVTERRRIEEERDRLFNLSLDMLCIAGFDGYFKQLNPAWEKTLGWTNEELMSKPYLEFVHPGDRESTINSASGLSKGEVIITFENRYLCKDGSYKWISWNSVPLVEERLIFAVTRDITELKRAEEELKRLNSNLEYQAKQLEAANKELEAFSYSVSHDLRVPLRAVDGFSLIVLEDYGNKIDDEGKRILNTIRDNTKKMGQLIDDLLAFSRIGRKEMTLSETNMEELALAAFEELRPNTVGRKVQLDIKPLPRAYGDEAMMRQVLVNLLSNAIKFTRLRETAVVEVGGKTGENENIYYVKDNGVGFDMQYVNKLFGMFQRLHSQEEFEGTGIGLAIVQRVVHKHGGRVWAEGNVNEGAAFYFVLPRRGEPSSQSTECF